MKILPYTLFAVLFAIVSFSGSHLAAQDFSQEAPAAGGDGVVDVINNSSDHAIFAELIEETNLTATLSQQGPFTVLAPTNDAFTAVSGELEELRQSPQQLQNVIINHLFQGQADANEIEENFNVDVAEGDIEADNGVIHSINEVIFER